MRVLTVRQPWAGALIFGGKDVENRTRSLGGYEGPVAIHAGLQFDDIRSNEAWRLMRETLGEEGVLDLMVNDFLVLGHVLGVVDLVGTHEEDECWTGVALRDGSTHEQHCSPWAEDADVHHLVLANPRPLFEPIPYRGGLGLRHATPELIAAIEADPGR